MTVWRCAVGRCASSAVRWLGHETTKVTSRPPRSRCSASHGEASGARCGTSDGNLSSMRFTTAGQTGEITGAGSAAVGGEVEHLAAQLVLVAGATDTTSS